MPPWLEVVSEDGQLLEKPSGAGAAQEMVAVPEVRKGGGLREGGFLPAFRNEWCGCGHVCIFITFR